MKWSEQSRGAGFCLGSDTGDLEQAASPACASVSSAVLLLSQATLLNLCVTVGMGDAGWALVQEELTVPCSCPAQVLAVTGIALGAGPWGGTGSWISTEAAALSRSPEKGLSKEPGEEGSPPEPKQHCSQGGRGTGVPRKLLGNKSSVSPGNSPCGASAWRASRWTQSSKMGQTGLQSRSQRQKDPVRTGACTLRPIGLNPDVQVSYTTSKTIRGCVSSSTVGKDREVHVLNVKSLTENSFLLLNVSLERKAPERKVVLAIYSSNPGTVILHSWPVKMSPRQDAKPNIIFRAKVLIFEDGTEARLENASLPDNSEELVKWAVTTYGGITSYTELENPQHIFFRLGEDASSPPDCHPQAGFNARHYLQAELLSNDVKTCTSNEMKEKEAHILWVQGPEDPSSWETDVNVEMNCQNGEVPQNLQRMLVLQSQPNMSWLLNLQQDMQIMASGNYALQGIPMKVAGNNLPNTEQGLINRVLEMNYSIIASYLDIPSASNVTIRIQKCAQKKEISTTTAGQSLSLDDQIRSELNLMRPWKCTNDSIEIAMPGYLIPGLDLPIAEVTLQDSNCKATKNGSQFVLMSLLEKCSTVVKDGIHVTNKLILTLAGPQQEIQVPFGCQIPVQDREMSLQLFHNPEFRLPSTTVLEANKVAYVQVRLWMKDDKPELELLECQLELAGQEPLPLVKDNKPCNPTVEILQLPEPTLDRKTQRFSFIYSPGDDQQAPPTASLLCRIALQYSSENSAVLKKSLKVTLQDSKFPPQNPGLGMGAVLGITFGAFLIGALLTAALWYIYSHTRPTAKMQPVSVNPPASESSSTSHSIGSTQSTPCSNSSMA
ncbi:endoglin precursor isoform A [Alligator mississippiensis]|uniref:Endoglin isoform A n=1 Tax=Alligator mississippiensis TaxID=8496 RepID=A0A151MFC1_ALLMI|nr:endoglin precursor isoform A [Alligator mississippiensis]